jgi:hypothetical protein
MMPAGIGMACLNVEQPIDVECPLDRTPAMRMRLEDDEDVVNENGRGNFM